MCYLLSKIGEQLTELHLMACDELRIVTLVTVLSWCCNLKMLELYRAGMSYEDMQIHLLSSTQNRLPKLEKLRVDPATFDVLMDFVTNPINTVDAKWRKVLVSKRLNCVMIECVCHNNMSTIFPRLTGHTICVSVLEF